MRKILITGSAGFIGFHLCKRLLHGKNHVFGTDNINAYYDVELKKSRLDHLKKFACKYDHKFNFFLGNLEDDDFIKYIFEKEKYDFVLHMGAQAGVRYSIENPNEYISSNIKGFLNILEASKKQSIKHLIFASSSSVYGGNTKYPYEEKHSSSHPLSLYAATKKSNELMAHVYSHLFNLPCSGLRFFTVYGPWGRPDMAPMIFTKNIIENKPINIFNNGEMERDFTYIDDVVEIIYRLLDKPPTSNKLFNKDNPDPSNSWAPYKIYNVGNSNPVKLIDFVNLIEKELGKKAIKNFLPMQKGDVRSTAADTRIIEELIGYKSKTDIKIGIKKFIEWFKNYYNFQP